MPFRRKNHGREVFNNDIVVSDWYLTMSTSFLNMSVYYCIMYNALLKASTLDSIMEIIKTCSKSL